MKFSFAVLLCVVAYVSAVPIAEDKTLRCNRVGERLPAPLITTYFECTEGGLRLRHCRVGKIYKHDCRECFGLFERCRPSKPEPQPEPEPEPQPDPSSESSSSSESEEQPEVEPTEAPEVPESGEQEAETTEAPVPEQPEVEPTEAPEVPESGEQESGEKESGEQDVETTEAPAPEPEPEQPESGSSEESGEAPGQPGDCEVTCNADDYYLVNPSDCNSFYQCSNGVPVFQPCPAGLVFNPNVRPGPVCDYPYNYQCTPKSCDAAPQPQPETCPPVVCPEVEDPFGDYFPDAANCGKFYQCAHGLPVSQTCPAGLHFNPRASPGPVCDYPVNAQCTETC